MTTRKTLPDVEMLQPAWLDRDAADKERGSHSFDVCEEWSVCPQHRAQPDPEPEPEREPTDLPYNGY